MPAAAQIAAPPRRNGFESRRLEILRSAAQVFAEEGYHETSVSSLAEQLGVSKPVLYYYAKNKDDLLFQCGEIARAALRDAIEEAAAAHMSGLGRLRRFFSAYSEIMCGEFGRCLALVDHRALNPDTRAKDIASRRAMEAAVSEMLREGQADGTIGRCDPVLTTRALFGAFNGIPRWFSRGGKLTASDVTDSYLDVFVMGLSKR